MASAAASEKSPHRLEKVAEGLWVMEFPMTFFGMELGRRVTLLRTGEDEIVLHSTGPFSKEDVEAIQQLGRVTTMIEGTTMHDTFSPDGQAAFPEVSYFVPEGFPKSRLGPHSHSLRAIAEQTDGEVEAQPLEGLRFLNEYACYHPRTRTLIVCDLIFNLVHATGWTRWAMRYLNGVRRWPAIDRPVRLAVKDPALFTASLQKIFEWDFIRLIPAHGDVIKKDARAQFSSAVREAGFKV